MHELHAASVPLVTPMNSALAPAVSLRVAVVTCTELCTGAVFADTKYPNRLTKKTDKRGKPLLCDIQDYGGVACMTDSTTNMLTAYMTRMTAHTPVQH